MAGTKRTRASEKPVASVSSEYVSVSDDGFVASDSDAPASKKTKVPASKASTSNASTSNSAFNSEVFHDLSTGRQPRRVNVSEFKGKKLVNIREYYEKDGEMLPGKKVPNRPNLTDLTKQLGMLRDCLQGISLNAEQFTELLKALPDIKKALGYAEEDAGDDETEQKERGSSKEPEVDAEEKEEAKPVKKDKEEPVVDGVKLTKKEIDMIKKTRKHPNYILMEKKGRGMLPL